MINDYICFLIKYINMKQLLFTFLFTFLLLPNLVISQTGFCGTYHGSFEEERAKHPEFYKQFEALNKELEAQHIEALSKMTNIKTENGKKIIPVVVHVIHENGPANISDADIQYGLDILNANINGQGANFLTKTPDVFAQVRGNLNVEFRLAKIDPEGNPTTGINRVYSSLATRPNPRNAVKALSYWSSFQYFNIWTVRAFMPQDDGNTLLGYAQFPWSGSMSTDGVVLLSSQMATGGTLTHEVGHWLGLRHVWGDALCGDDNIIDTPPAEEANFNVDISDFPYHVGQCLADSMNWAGEMFCNYMDYADDADVTMFTKGQDVVMNQTLEGLDGAFGYRQYLWSEENIEATGTKDGYKPPTCTQQAYFDIAQGTEPTVCDGAAIYLKGNKNQFGAGNVTSIIWNFGNGETNNSVNDDFIDQFPAGYTYNAAGDYDVSLTIEYNETTQATASSLSDLDISTATSYDSTVTDLIVQGTQAELISMGANNIVEILLDSIGLYYGMQDSSYFRGIVKSVTYIAYYANTCTANFVREKFIRIGSNSATNTSSSYSYSFETEDEVINDDWTIISADNIVSPWSFTSSNNSSWEWSSNVASSGSGSISMLGDKGAIGTHQLISEAYDLSGLTAPAFKFDWAAAAINTFPENELNIYFSTDCGNDWDLIDNASDPDKIETANAGLYSFGFKPSSEEWSSLILTNPLLKDNNIMFRIEYVVEEASNNLFIDNIIIGEESALIEGSQGSLSKLSVFPNPTLGDINVRLDNLADQKIRVSIINILGLEVMEIFNGKIDNKFHSLNANIESLDRGVYFIKVENDNNIISTKKILLDK